MRQKYFNTPFAFAGDQTPINDALQPSGVVSFNQGWGFDYQRDQASDPLAKPVDRMEMNYLQSVITAAIQQYQQSGFPEFITEADNGGNPYPYARGAIVLWSPSGNPPFGTYVSLVDNNTTDPSNTTNWMARDFAQTETPGTPEATPDTVMMRDDSGRAQVANPLNDLDIVNKQTLGSYWLLTPLAADLDVYVSAATGDDATADGTDALPFATVMAALNWIAGTFYLGAYNVTVHIAAGQYAEDFNPLPKYETAGGVVTLQGVGQDASTGTRLIPATRVLVEWSSYKLYDLRIQAGAGSGGNVVIVQDMATVTIGNVTVVVSGSFPTASGGVFRAHHASLFFTGTLTCVLGGYTGHSLIACIMFSHVNLAGNFVISGNPALITAVDVYFCSVLYISSGAWSGSMTGRRYLVQYNSVIWTGGAGTNFFPGTIAGQAADGGIYV